MVSTKTGFESKTEEQRQANIKRGSDLNNLYNNPCLKEHKMSLDCLDRNGYKHDKCGLQFANYKACREFWNRVQAERRRQGIYPYLPYPEDREKIQAEYFAKHK